MSQRWQTGEALDGPALVAWLEEAEPGRVRADVIGPSLMRRINEWRRGGRASVWTADHALVRLGRHLSEVPDAAWRSRERLPVARSSGRRLSEAEIAALLDAVRRGTETKAIARRLGCAPATVRYHRQRIAA